VIWAARARDIVASVTAEKVFVAYDFKIAGGLRDDLQAARDMQPREFDISFAAQDDDPLTGEIWRNRLRPRLLESPRIVAYVDLPNANVGFEIGFALGQREGKKVILARAAAGEPPSWVGLPPLAGFLSARFENGRQILAAIEGEQNWYSSPARPELGNKTILLCPQTAGGSYDDLLNDLGWARPPYEGWNLNDLSRVLDGVGAVVWMILPHKEGPDGRDGGENAALSIIAGYCHASGVPLVVLAHADSRAVVDVDWHAIEFKSRLELKEKLPVVTERIRAEMKQREPKLAQAVASVVQLRRPDVGKGPTMSFGEVRERFVGREGLLGDLREAVGGLAARQSGQMTEGPRDVRVAWYFGYGGMGKSYFLRRALVEVRDQLRGAKVGLVDWDDGASEFRLPLTHPPLTASDLLQPIAYRLGQLYGAEALDPYWSVCQRVDAVQQERAELRQSFQEQLDRLRRGEDVGQALRAVLVGNALAASGPERPKTVEALQAPLLREEIFIQWYHQGGGAVSDRDAALDPDGLRVTALQACIAELSSRTPLVLVLDTCEILQMAEQADLDGWLRKLVVPLCQGQLPFMLIVASRLQPDTGVRAGARDSWRERLEGGRLRATHFDEGQRFTAREISVAAAKLSHVSEPDPELVDKIHRLTLGVPLAVRILFDECAGDPHGLERILHEEEAGNDDERPDVDPEQVVVAQMTGRFLLHLQGRPERQRDYHAIIALALLREIDHEILARMWPDASVGSRLRELASRYGLVGRGDLHATVRRFLRQHWFSGDRNRDVEEVIAVLVKAVDGTPVPHQAGDLEYFRAMAQRLNARLWAKGAAAIGELASVLCLALAFDEHVDELLALAREIPLPGRGNPREVVSMLHHLPGEYWFAPWQDAALMRWLSAERTVAQPAWTEEQKAALKMFEGLRLAEEGKHHIAAGHLLESLACFQHLSAIPRSSQLGETLFEIGLKLEDHVDDGALSIRVYDAAAAAGYDRASCANNKGKTLADVDRHAEAEAQFRLAVELNPREALYSRNLALSLDILDRSVEAEAMFRRAIEVDPGSVESYGLYAVMLSRRGRPAEAEAVLHQAVDSNAGSAAALCLLGHHLFERSDTDRAEQAYLKALELDTRSAEAHNGFANVLAAKGQPIQAEAEYLRAIALGANEPMFQRNLALVLEKVDRVAEAEAAYRTAISLRPGYASGAGSLAALLDRLGRVSDADAVVRRCAETSPPVPQALALLGNRLRQKAQLAEAEGLFRKALALAPRDAAIHDGFAAVLDDRADADSAEAEYRKAIALNPGEALYQTNLGLFLKKRKRRAEAEAAYRRALEIQPRYDNAVKELARLLDEDGRSRDAEDMLRASTSAEPGKARAFFALAEYLHDKGRLDEAIRAYENGLALDSRDPSGHNSLGNVLFDAREFARAEDEYRQAIELDSGEPICRRNLGLLLQKVGRPVEAEAAYRGAIEIRPTYIDGVASLAKLLAANGREKEAETLLRKCAEGNPEQAKALIALGNHLCHTGATEEAVRVYERAIELAPDSDDAHTRLANVLRDRGDLLRAEAEHRRAIALDDREPIYRRNLGLVLNKAGRLAEAEVAFRDALDLRPNYVDGAESLAELLAANGRAVEAEATLRRCAEAKPEQSGAFLALGNHLRDAGTTEEAVRAYERAIELAPDSDDAHTRLANVLLERGDLTRAEAEYRRAIVLDSHEAVYRRNLGRVLRKVDRLAEAEVAYREALELKPTYVDAAKNLAELLTASGRAADAETILRRCAEAKPERSEAFVALGDHLNARGETEEAVRAYERAIALDPNSDDAHTQLANVLFKRGDLAGAEVEYHRAIDLDAREPIYRRNLGRALHKAGRFADAEAAYQKALDLRATYTAAAEDLAELLEALGRAADAETVLRKCAEANPERSEALLALGSHLRDKGETEEAVRLYQRAIALAPDSDEAHNRLANVLLERGDLPGAEAEYRRAVALDAREPIYHRNLGRLVSKVGRLDEAEAAYREALGLRPTFTPAAEDLAALLHASGRSEEATTVLRRCAEVPPERVDAFVALGRHLRVKGDLVEAMRAFQHALAMAPEDADAHNGLGNVFLAQSDLIGAESEFRAAIAAAAKEPVYRWNLAIVLGQTKRHAEQIATLRETLDVTSKGDRADTLNLLAWTIYECSGDLVEAERLASEAIQLAPREGTILHTLATIQLRLHGWKGAQASVGAWIQSPEGASFDKKYIRQAVQLAMADGHGLDLCELMSSSTNSAQWQAWIDAIRSGRDEPPG